MSSGGFRSSSWDPPLIVAQIACLQSCFYVIVSIVTLVAEAIASASVSTAHILDYRSFRGDTVLGWSLALGWELSAVITCIPLLWIVGRARQCLDFSVTLHLVHLFFSYVYNGIFPFTLFWWILNISSCAVMAMGSEWLCMRWELEPILLRPSPSAPSSTNTTGNSISRPISAQERKRTGELKRKNSIAYTPLAGSEAIDEVDDEGQEAIEMHTVATSTSTTAN